MAVGFVVGSDMHYGIPVAVVDRPVSAPIFIATIVLSDTFWRFSCGAVRGGRSAGLLSTISLSSLFTN